MSSRWRSRERTGTNGIRKKERSNASHINGSPPPKVRSHSPTGMSITTKNNISGIYFYAQLLYLNNYGNEEMTKFTFDIPNTTAIDAFKKLHHMPYSLLLDSADEQHPDAKYSFVAFMPIETVEAKNGEVQITNQKGQNIFDNINPFDAVQECLRHYRLSVLNDPSLPPFQGGAAGFFGYDLGRTLETLPGTAEDNEDMPDMAVGIYDQVFAYDHKAKTSTLIIQTDSEEQAQAKYQHFMKLLDAKAPQSEFNAFEPDWRGNFTKNAYMKQVQRIINYIRKGDIFQTNMTQRFDAELPNGFDAFSHYLNLREVSPAPFASYFNLGHIKISSSSPERFLTAHNGIVETKPIKGTAARLDDKSLNQLNMNALENSEKERAENVMIVDLLRNDLSKVCRPDAVDVVKLCALESFANVHHLVSTLRAKLRQGYSAAELLKSCFPGGSITGAPKIRAMEIIEELEPTRRGPYCGSMGYIGFDDTMDTNILIRTLVYQGNSVSFQVGGGITVDSNPEQEYQETLDKAQGILNSFTQDKQDKKRKAA